MLISEPLNIFLTWSPIITPLFTVAWFVHILDKRIAVVENTQSMLDAKIQKIYEKLTERL